MPGISIPASEHSTMTAWGRDHEVDAFENVLNNVPEGIVADARDDSLRYVVEHSTMTAWGRDHEVDAFENVLNNVPEGIVACVSDSYDIYNAVRNLWGGKLRDRVMQRNGTLVI